MLYREIMDVCSQIHTKHINTAVRAESRFLFIPELYLKTQSVPPSKHTPSLLHIFSMLQLYNAKFAVFSYIRIKHIQTM